MTPIFFVIPIAMLALARRRPSARSSASVIDARSTDEGQQNRNFRLTLRGPGRWRRGHTAPAGFTARPGAPATALNPGECAEYLGGGGRWWVCCKSHTPDSGGNYSYSCYRLGSNAGPWSDPLWMRRSPQITTRNRSKVPMRNRRGHGHGGGWHGGHGHPALLAWRSWPLAPWALPGAGYWNAGLPPLGCTIVTGKKVSELRTGECAVYGHGNDEIVCARDERGAVHCKPRLTYLQQPAFA